jgi:hypothetical protein
MKKKSATMRYFIPLLSAIFIVLLCLASIDIAAFRAARPVAGGSFAGAFQQTTVSLPQASGNAGTSAMIAISTTNLTGLGVVAYDFTLVFDQNVLQLQSPAFDSASTLSSAMTITPNASTPGRLTISAFGTGTLSGAGTLLNLKFNVVGGAGSSTALTFQRFQFNEGTPAANTVAGSFTVNGGGGNCSYSLFPTSASFASSGGNGNFNVTTNPTTGCNWTAASDSLWITINSSAGGAVNYSVASNGGAVRTGTIMVQGQTHTVTQAGTDNCVPVSISSSLSAQPGAAFTVPIMTGNLAGKGIIAYDLTVSFDPSVVSLQNPAFDTAGTLSSGMTITPNTSTAGRIVISAFGTAPLSGEGTLINLRFNFTGAASSCSNLTWTIFRFNEGNPCSSVSGGRVCGGTSRCAFITGASVSGKKLFVNGTDFSPGAEVFMNGAKQKKTSNDPANPTTVLIAAKSGKKIARGQTVTLQARNTDGCLSNQFVYTRP